MVEKRFSNEFVKDLIRDVLEVVGDCCDCFEKDRIVSLFNILRVLDDYYNLDGDC